MITVKDDLTDSSGALSPNTQIDVITTQGAGTTLTSATYSYTTDDNGHYEFTLNNGVHVLSVKYNGYSKGLGEVYVNDDTPSPITINDLLGLHSPIPPSYVQTIIDSLNEATQARDEAVAAANDSVDILVQNQAIQSDVTNKANQVSQDAIQVSQDKADVEANAQQVAIDRQDVSNKAQQVSNDAAQVAADKQSVEQTAADVTVKAQQVSDDADQVAQDKLEVANNAQSVANNTQAVADNAIQVAQDAQQVAQDTQTVATNTQTVLDNTQQVSLDTAQVAQDKQAVEAARAEVESNTTIASDAAVTATEQATIATNAAAQLANVVHMQSSPSQLDEYGYPNKALYENGDGFITYYPEYAVFRKDGGVWEYVTPHLRNVVTFNGVSQYISIPEVPIGSDIELTVSPTSNGNSGLPSDCPALTDGTIQTVTFTTTEAITELARNGSNYYHGALLGMKVDGVNYRFDEGWRGDNNQVLVNYATELGEELVVNGDFSNGLNGWNVVAAQDSVITVEDGRCRLTRPTTNSCYIKIDDVKVSGKTYLQTTEVEVLTGYLISEGAGLNGGSVTATGNTTIKNAIIADGSVDDATLDVAIVALVGSDGYVDNVSVRQSDGYGTYVGLTEASWTEEEV